MTAQQGKTEADQGKTKKSESGGGPKGKNDASKRFFDGAGKKLRDRVEQEATDEALSAFRKWRQRLRHGVLPIGLAHVGKTTFLNKFASNGPDMFLGFNRTQRISIEGRRLRDDLRAYSKEAEFYRGIDVPGELPEDWAKAYFDVLPRVLVVLVDNRPAVQHIEQLGKFLAALKEGPGFWQKAKALVTFNFDNLAGIVFVVNKADQFSDEGTKVDFVQYKSFLADLRSLLSVPIFQHQMSLVEDEDSELTVFRRVVELFDKK